MRHPARIASLLAALAASSSALARPDTYEFDTSTGQVTKNGSVTFMFEGVPIWTGAVTAGVRAWTVAGDMILPASVTVKFKGDHLAKVLVGGDLRAAGAATISADALLDQGGPGGGDGGDGGEGGNGGPGGTGFGADAQGDPVPGQNGQPANGPLPGAPGLLPRQGGLAGTGNMLFGEGGGAGFSAGIGNNAASGDPGQTGSPGGLGVNNLGAAVQGGLSGGPGTGGPGGSTPVGGGSGGAAGAAAGSGSNGSAGQVGFTGGRGGAGFNANGYSPTTNLIPVLNGGNAGSGGGGGGGAGGGGGGMSGSAGGGGGGGGGSPDPECQGIGGGGGGGGAGGGGGRGGDGGPGGKGSKGGGGGGGLQFVVMGRVDGSIAFSARGAIGPGPALGSNGSPGLPGAVGGQGGAGAAGSGCNAQAGGRGGDGGAGGQGGQGGLGGDGGSASAGAGGVLFLAATRIDPAGSADISSPGGQPGRVLYGDAVAGNAPTLNHPVNPAPLSTSLDFVPRFTHSYFTTPFASPNIIPDSSTGLGVLGGPAPFGALPNIQSDPRLVAALAARPADTLAIVMRYDAGPLGFAMKYNTELVFQFADTLDLFLVFNVTPHVANIRWNGQRIASLPFTLRPEFGGSGQAVPVGLTTFGAWAVLGPESFVPTPVTIRFGNVEQTVNLAPPLLDNASFAYITGIVAAPCNLADITDIGDTGDGPDGQLTVDDMIAFVNAFSDGTGCPGLTPCNVADVSDIGTTGAGPDGQLTVDDVIAFVNAFGDGC